MQAHPLSSIAALTSLPSAPALPAVAAFTPRRPLATRLPVAESAGLAHDAGNLLGALHLYCGLLQSPGVLQPEHRHYAQELSLISARSSALIRRLLGNHSIAHEKTRLYEPDSTLAAMANGAASPSAVTSACPATVLRALVPVLDRIAAGAAAVTLHAPASLPPVDLPAEVLERIAVNLVRNAAEAIRQARGAAATQPAGSIRISLDLHNRALRLAVEDNGPGMPPDVAAAFLRPAPLAPGTERGLGHRIVHELAAATGAQLSIRVRPGRGTHLCLRWPLPAGHPGEYSASLPQEAAQPC